MRSVKAGREPRGRRFRTPRRKARCLAARLSRRCPSKPLVAWSDAVTTVKEKDVAARFRRGDVLLKPQHEPDYGKNNTMRDATRTVRTASSIQRRDGAQGMCTGRRRRGETGTRTQGRRNGEAEVAQPAAFAEQEETWNDPPPKRRACDENRSSRPGRGLLLSTQADPASSCGTARAPTRGGNQVMACGMQTEPARRAVGLATTATLEDFEEISSYREAALEPRRCLEQNRVSPAHGGNVRRTKGP